MYVGPHLILLAEIWEVYLIYKVYYFAYNIPVDSDSSTACWMYPVTVHFPRGRSKVSFFDIIVCITSFHSDLSWTTSLLTRHSKEILSGYDVAFKYYFYPYFIPCIYSCQWLYHHPNMITIDKPQFILGEFSVLAIRFIINLYSSLYVGCIYGDLMHKFTPSTQNNCHRL